MEADNGNHTAQQEPKSTERPPWWKRLWRWTEFGEKSGWDWLQLLVVPVLVGILAVILTAWFNNQQSERQQRIETQRTEAERELTEQQAQDAALQAYLDRMSELMLDKNLRGAEGDSNARVLATARTTTILSTLDANRKATVMMFLVRSGLIQGRGTRVEDALRILGERERAEQRAEDKIREAGMGINPFEQALADLSDPCNFEWAQDPWEDNRTQEAPDEPIISLEGSDLRGVQVFSTSLRGAHLPGAELSEASLSDADLVGTNLVGADLKRADLSGSCLINADLLDADLVNADLVNADLTNADLSYADLEDADLSYADLEDATGITNKKLDRSAYSLSNTTMPNGQKYEDWLKDEGSGKD